MRPMKIGILAGGVGTRLAEETETKPKPMVEIGGRPILWHIMMLYRRYFSPEFFIALGYKGEYIKKYMADYCQLTSDMTVDLKDGTVLSHDNRDRTADWKVHLIDTGKETLTGGRIKRLAPFLKDGATFMLTWGDGVSDVDLEELLEFHKSHGKLATLTAVRPTARFGHLDFRRRQGLRVRREAADGRRLDQRRLLRPRAGDSRLHRRRHDPVGARADGAARPRWTTHGLPAYVILAVHGYACATSILLEALWNSGNPPWKLGLSSMRVLVTGHRGYIGTIMVPMLQNRGHRSRSGSTAISTNECTFGGSVRRGSETIHCDIRDVKRGHVSGLRCHHPFGGSVERSIGRFRSVAHRRHQPSGDHQAGELAKRAGVQRFIFSSSCSTYGAAGDDFLDETSDVQSGDAVRQIKGRCRKPGWRSWRMIQLQLRSSCASATAYGVSPRMRFDLVVNNLTAWAFTTGRCCSRAMARHGGRLSISSDISARSSPRSKPLGKQSTLQAFNVGRTDRELPHSRASRDRQRRSSRAARVEYAPGAGPDKRCYRVDCEKIRRVLPASSRNGTRAKAWRSSTRPTASGSDAGGLRGSPIPSPGTSQVPHRGGDHRRRSAACEKGRRGRRPCPGRRKQLTNSRFVRVELEAMHGNLRACRSCGGKNFEVFLDLGSMPLADRMLKPKHLDESEPLLPARSCFLPRLRARPDRPHRPTGELFGNDYPYFSSVSDALQRTFAANVLRDRSRRASSGPTAWSSSSRATTATC